MKDKEQKLKEKAEKWLEKDVKRFENPNSKIRNRRVPNYVADYMIMESANSSEEIEIPPLSKEELEFCSRLVKRHAKDYNPKEDKFFIVDSVSLICRNSKPLILTEQQKKLIGAYFVNCKSIKVADRLIDKLTKKIDKLFYGQK